MLNPYRKTFFTLFAVFFVLSLPFLLIFSLGYNLNFESQSIQHSLTVQLQTVPRNAEIKVQARSYRTPLEIKIKENTLTKVNLDLSGFHSEQFFFSSLQSNAALRLRDVWLLSQDPFLEFDLQDYTFLNFLSQDYVLLEKDEQVFVQNIGFFGLQSQPEPIALDSLQGISQTRFEILLEGIFWHPNQQVVIYKDLEQNAWQVLNLQNLSFSVASIASLSSSQVLILDQEGGVWGVDLETQDFTFLDSGFQGLSFTQNPNTIWLLKRNSIFRLNSQNSNQKVDFRNLNLMRNRYSQHHRFRQKTLQSGVLDYQNFTVRSIFLGFSLEIEKSLFYIDDSNKSLLSQITNQAEIVGASSNTLFWLDSKMNLNSYNFLHQEYKFLANLKNYFTVKDSSEIRISYYQGWNRLMLYSSEKTVSIWFDSFSLNSSIAKYQPVNWVQDKKCFQEVIQRHQFCFSSDSGYFYRNNSFFR